MPVTNHPIQNHNNTKYPAANQSSTQKHAEARSAGNTERLFENGGKNTENGRSQNHNQDEPSCANLCHKFLTTHEHTYSLGYLHI